MRWLNILGAALVCAASVASFWLPSQALVIAITGLTLVQLGGQDRE